MLYGFAAHDFLDVWMMMVRMAMMISVLLLLLLLCCCCCCFAFGSICEAVFLRAVFGVLVEVCPLYVEVLSICVS